MAKRAKRRLRQPVETAGKSLEELIQTTRIEPDEMIYLVQEMTKRHDQGNGANWYTQIAILADRYPRGDDRPICIMERMRCLIPMMKDSRMRGWSMDAADPKCNLTNAAVFHATAKARIHLANERLSFDPDEFFELLMAETPAEGNA